MSRTRFDNALIVVPEDMYFRPTDGLSNAALEVFIQLFPGAEEYQAEMSEQIHFFSPEDFASSVACPVCGVNTQLGESSESVGRKWFYDIDRRCSDQSVENIETVLPACGHSVPVIGLHFDWPAGYAKYALSARYCYWEEEWEPDGSPPPELTEEMRIIGNILGISVKPIRKYFAILPSDRRLIERLVSGVEADRLKAVLELEDLEPGHFEEHGISPWFVEANAERLLVTYRNTRHEPIKRWILILIAYAGFVNDEILDIVSRSLDRNCEVLSPTLNLIYQNAARESAARFQHLISEIKQLHNHPDTEVRWRCAMVLRFLSLDYEKDADVIRALMLDDCYATRTEAVGAFKNALGRRIVDENDRTILEKLIEKDGSGAAAYYAKQLLLTRGYRRPSDSQ
jgi:hypothetical protein